MNFLDVTLPRKLNNQYAGVYSRVYLRISSRILGVLCNTYFHKVCLAIAMYILGLACANAQNFTYTKDRLETDMEVGAPLVAHATVVLCTNRTKKTDLCDADTKRTNLYWGARYGIKTYFNKSKQWQRISVAQRQTSKKANGSLERVVFKRTLDANGIGQDIYLVADVWRGGDVKKAITHFLKMSSGEAIEKIQVDEETTIYAGGDSHVVAYLGHNGLANFSLDVDLEKTTSPNSSIVLGRRTAKTFIQYLDRAGSFPLLTTKGVVTPEAYVLEAALVSWFSGDSPSQVRHKTAETFSKFQKASLGWSKSLFVSGLTQGQAEN